MAVILRNNFDTNFDGFTLVQTTGTLTIAQSPTGENAAYHQHTGAIGWDTLGMFYTGGHLTLGASSTGNVLYWDYYPVEVTGLVCNGRSTCKFGIEKILNGRDHSQWHPPNRRDGFTWECILDWTADNPSQWFNLKASYSGQEITYSAREDDGTLPWEAAGWTALGTKVWTSDYVMFFAYISYTPADTGWIRRWVLTDDGTGPPAPSSSSTSLTHDASSQMVRRMGKVGR